MCLRLSQGRHESPGSPEFFVWIWNASSKILFRTGNASSEFFVWIGVAGKQKCRASVQL